MVPRFYVVRNSTCHKERRKSSVDQISKSILGSFPTHVVVAAECSYIALIMYTVSSSYVQDVMRLREEHELETASIRPYHLFLLLRKNFVKLIE